MKRVVCVLIISLMVPAFAGAAIQNIQASNNTSAGVTISWITDSDTRGEVHYSKTPDLSNPSKAYDARGQVFVDCTHYVNIANLQKETTYYFEVISGGEIDNNNGSYYTFKTMKEPFAPPGICLIYGFVYQEDGTTPAEGTIVHLWLTHNGVDSYPLSWLISSNGSFVMNLKEARSVSTDDLFSSIDSGDPISLEALYCGNYSTNDNLEFEVCPQNVGSMTLGSSYATTTTLIASTTTTVTSTSTAPVTSTSTTPATSTSTTAITVPTTTPTTAPTPAPTTTPTTIPLIPETTSTSTQSSTSTTTAKPSTTTTIIPLPEYEVNINPPFVGLSTRDTVQFNAITTRNGEVVAGDYKWSVDSSAKRGGSIGENGLYKAGTKVGTDMVTVIDIAHGSSSATAEVNVSLLWPMAYDKMWGEKKGENLSLLRAFRDEVLSESEMGREYIFMLYNNSLEILILLIMDPSLTKETKEVIDELLPGIQSLLEGKKMILSRETKAHMEVLLNRLEKRAVSRRLKKALKKVRKDLRKGKIFKQFDSIDRKTLIGKGKGLSLKPGDLDYSPNE